MRTLGDQWRRRHVEDNGNVIADSGEGYATKQKAKREIESVKQDARDAGIETS